jgi:hypothetical protein
MRSAWLLTCENTLTWYLTSNLQGCKSDRPTPSAGGQSPGRRVRVCVGGCPQGSTRSGCARSTGWQLERSRRASSSGAWPCNERAIRRCIPGSTTVTQAVEVPQVMASAHVDG